MDIKLHYLLYFINYVTKSFSIDYSNGNKAL